MRKVVFISGGKFIVGDLLDVPIGMVGQSFVAKCLIHDGNAIGSY